VQKTKPAILQSYDDPIRSARLPTGGYKIMTRIAGSPSTRPREGTRLGQRSGTWGERLPINPVSKFLTRQFSSTIVVPARETASLAPQVMTRPLR
jgi:hypothetical protein